MCKKVWRFRENSLPLPLQLKFTEDMEIKRSGAALEIDREEVGLELTKWRIRQGLTQRELAERWGMSRYTIIRAEKGKNVSWRFAYAIWSKLVTEMRKEGGNE